MTPARSHWTSLTALLIAVLLAPLAQAVTVVSGPVVTQAGSSALIEWRTDVETGTRVKYGRTADQLTLRAEGEVSREHRVKLEGLNPGTTYFFEFGTAKRALGTGSFQTSVTGGGAQKALPKVQAGSAAKPVPAKQEPGSSSALVPPPTRMTWANLDSLADHYNRHGADFRAASADDYAAQAWGFLQRARKQGLPMKWDAEDQTLRVWEPSSRSFAAYDRRGRTRTYFRPSNPGYWDRQPGDVVTSARLPF